ncbi:hypothetical protein DTO207G8_4806 [Paecilomyces variotii]|nr:hypothetical protein DTO207G8_4806 [Paecilomyces variotii]
MQFFRRNKSHAAEASVERSRARSHGELLVEAPGNRQHPAFPPPAGDHYKDDEDSSYQQRQFSRQRFSYHEPSQSQTYQDHPGDSSRASRNSVSSAKPTVINLSTAEQSWPLPAPVPETPRSDRESRKLKKGIFGRHSSSRDEGTFLGRNISVKRKGGSPRQQSNPQHQNVSQQSITSDGGASGRDDESTAAKLNKEAWNPSNPELQMQHMSTGSPQGQTPYGQPAANRYPQPSQSPTRREYPSIQRVNTEPINTGSFYQQRVANDSFHSQVSPRRLPQNPEDLRQSSPQQPLFRAIQYSPSDSSIKHSPHQTQIPQDPFSMYRRNSSQPDPGTAQRPPSQQSYGPPSPVFQWHQSDTKQQSQAPRQLLQPISQPLHQGGMSPAERSASMRQPTESAQQQGQVSDNQGSAQSPYVQSTGAPAQGPSLKSEMSQQNIQEQGRETPPPQSKSRDDLAEVDVRALLQKHEELHAKYQKVKRYYFEKENQVQQLQNTVAHQRMAASRTVLDDNEYTNRFTRLDGAIKDLAFSTRKDWKSIPTWLQPYVNEDAHTVGTKEMTAVGRAVITRWLVDELFERHFHPSIEPTLSAQLKNIEANIRRQSVKTYTEEDKENIIARISNWRRTTLDGLQDALQGKAAEENRTRLIDHLVEKLVASLEMHLNEPPPPGLDSSGRNIVENAVGIAEKIPFESRDVWIEYFAPGSLINDTHMKVETTLPPLKNPKLESVNTQGPSANDAQGDGQNDGEDAGNTRDDNESLSANYSADASSAAQQSSQQNMPPIREQRKRSVLGGLMGRKPTAAAAGPAQPQQEPSSRSNSIVAKETKDQGESEKNESCSATRIRFASFLAVEVRGKGPISVLLKAPVYPLE